ncbi:MAG TPA: hypothetical protein DEO70_12020 [Bacteroidales bacterium]|nr:MAG: hypothetical protein A2X11_10010 [Bacteroidetes bacterium GWE2_42_24]OFY25846.1 MAG: hypothetical protein A2X09_09385 [Bacteroidetes bacterium GWF2_43_11]HBZ67554.1 hypothetical protein [Bacteroidales bacterium]
MNTEIIKKFLTPLNIKSLKSEFNCSGDYVRKVCYMGTRYNHKMLSMALDMAIENRLLKKKEEEELQQKLEILKKA